MKCLPLNHSGLSLAQSGIVTSLDTGSGDESRNIGHDISKGRQEQETVESLGPKLGAHAERGNYEKTAQEGDYGHGTLHSLERVHLSDAKIVLFSDADSSHFGSGI
jgi:hypothetical protein